jgi:hypothetical protein
MNTYEDCGPCDTPSTMTSSIAKQPSEAMSKRWKLPHGTATAPAGAIDPPAPAVAVIVCSHSAAPAGAGATPEGWRNPRAGRTATAV